MTGIALAEGLPDIFTTTDGGEHWSGISDWIPYSLAPYFCYSYGEGMFRAITYEFGQIYTTYDNWQSVDSSLAILDTMHTRMILGCNFRGRDTLVAYGIHYLTDSLLGDSIHHTWKGPRLLLTWSTDGGKYWTEVPGLDSSFTMQGLFMSSLDRDYVLVAGLSNSGHNLIGMSNNHGISWEMDPVLRDSNYPPFIGGVTVTPQGHAIIIVTDPIRGSVGRLMRGERVESKVKLSNPNISATQIYPNPAMADLNIISADPSRSISLIDVLGRKVLSGILSASGQITLDVSKIPREIYNIVIDRGGELMSVGKVAVIGK